jgi:anion-transporting  ArsA/GET3 family ATPase
VGEALLRLSRGLGGLQNLLADPEVTRFVAVTAAAALPWAETARLLDSLRGLRIHVAAIVVNAVGAGRCRRCRSVARQQSRAMGRLVRSARTLAPAAPVLVTPASVPPPFGVASLERWRSQWLEMSRRQ